MKRKREENYKLCSWDKNGTSKNISPSVSFDSWLPASYALQNTPSLQSRHLKLTNGQNHIFGAADTEKNSIVETRKKKEEAMTSCALGENPKLLAIISFYFKLVWVKGEVVFMVFLYHCMRCAAGRGRIGVRRGSESRGSERITCSKGQETVSNPQNYRGTRPAPVEPFWSTKLTFHQFWSTGSYL